MFKTSNSVLNQFKKRSKNELTPLFAVAFYRNEENFVLSTYHEVSDFGVLEAGKIISYEQLSQELQSLGQQEKNLGGWLDKRMLFDNKEAVAWHSKARKNAMWFLNKSQKIKLNVHWPHLVFIYFKKAKKMGVFATLRANVALNTKLYYAPLCNVFSSGDVCQGSAKLPGYQGKVNGAFLTACEETIYESLFTTVQHKNTFHSVNVSDGVDTPQHLDKWRKLCTENRKVVASDLVDTGLRVADLVKEFCDEI